MYGGSFDLVQMTTERLHLAINSAPTRSTHDDGLFPKHFRGTRAGFLTLSTPFPGLTWTSNIEPNSPDPHRILLDHTLRCLQADQGQVTRFTFSRTPCPGSASTIVAQCPSTCLISTSTRTRPRRRLLMRHRQGRSTSQRPPRRPERSLLVHGASRGLIRCSGFASR